MGAGVGGVEDETDLQVLRRETLVACGRTELEMHSGLAVAVVSDDDHTVGAHFVGGEIDLRQVVILRRGWQGRLSQRL